MFSSTNKTSVARIKFSSLIVFFIMVIAGLHGIAHAATTVAVPGTCFKGGTTIQITWTLDPSANHGYHSIWQGASQPTYPNGQAAVVGGHYATSPLAWTLPLVTSSGYQSHVESHNPGHSVINAMESAAFAIDSSGPTTPTMTANSATDTAVALSWTAASDVGCMGLIGYKVYRGPTLINTSTNTSFTDTGLMPNTSYSYSVTAYDSFITSASSNTAPYSTKATPVAPVPKTTVPVTPAPTVAPINTVSAAVPAVQASGTVSCGSASDTAVLLTYKSMNTSQISLYKSDTILTSYATANKSGSYQVTGLQPVSSYNFSLRQGKAPGTELAKISCKTAAAPVAAAAAVTPITSPPSVSTKAVPEKVVATAAISPKQIATPPANPRLKLVKTAVDGLTLPLIVVGLFFLIRMRRQKPIVSADLGALASPPADTAIVVPAATTPQVVSTVLPVADTPAVTVPPQVIS